MIVRLSTLALTFILLLGCSLQNAPLPPNAASVTPAAGPTIAAASPTPAQTEAPPAWTIGLLDEPTNLLPFSVDGRAAAPIVEALFPAPVLGLNYTYTTTGVLDALPTAANGGAQVVTTTGFLDETGQFTVTETSQPTTTQQLVVTYRWNPQLRWADGTPLTAADSVFSYELFGQIQGSQEAQVVHTLIERYELVDEHTTRAVLKAGRIDPNYLVTAWPPLPRHRLQDLPPRDAFDQFAQQPLGYGPFTFQEQQPGEQLVLERNEYWLRRDNLPEQLIFRFFASADELRNAVVGGTVDAAPLERIPQELYPYLDQDQQSGAALVTFMAGPVYEHLDLNLADEHLHDPRVRQALAYAINRQAMIDAFFGAKGKPLLSWIVPEQRVFYAGDEQLTRYPYDPGKAGALLEAAGLTDKDGDGIRDLADSQPFTLTLLTTDTPLRTAMAERIAADLKAVGIQIQTEFQPIDQFYSATGPLYRRTFQLALFAWIAGVDPGGLPLWSCNAVPLQENGFSGNNFSGWCFEAAEWPLRRANSMLDERTRAQDYLKHQQLWSQEVPVIPLFQRPIAVIAHPRVAGIKPDPLAPITWNIDQWTGAQ